MKEDILDKLTSLENDVEFDEMLKPKVVKAKAIDSTANAVSDVWGLNSFMVEEVKKNQRLYKMKHGLFAGTPLLCKGSKCPYTEVCNISNVKMCEGQRCPMEAGAILARFESYCAHFGVGLTENVLPEEEVDLSLIRELVDIEIQILRASNKVAISGDFIGETISIVDKQGNPFYEMTVTPEAQFKLELMSKRHKVLQLLNSTRKDKQNPTKADASVKASVLMQKVENIRANISEDEFKTVIDVEIADDDLMNEDGSLNFDILDTLAKKF